MKFTLIKVNITLCSFDENIRSEKELNDGRRGPTPTLMIVMMMK